ncbi:MAG TPA: biopolymer transporter Tol [Gemmatales bacterium]|nr:biopolymer transporter Tol [Gemmatales bacterium]HMP59149.1 biopolymer transporter Tol [Gemmatales bacterium]
MLRGLVVVLLLTSCVAWAQEPESWSSQEAKFLSNIKQLTFDFARAGEAYFSPDQRHIIFQAEQKGENPFYQMFIMNLETGKTWRVSPGAGRTTCGHFHPSGEKVIFASGHTHPNLRQEYDEELAKRAEEQRTRQRRRYQWDFDEHIKIYESDLDGGNLRLLTDAPGYNAEGSYSPDGKQIVFTSNRDGNLELYIMNADGTGVRKLTNAPGCYNGGPFFSPDGKRVIFRADRQKKDFLQIHVINVDGTGDTQLTDTEGVNWGPYWHPDGEHIIYSGADHSNPLARPNYDLYVMHLATRRTHRVTFAPGADVLPVFSPDGKKLMWTSTRDGRMPGAQVFIADFTMPTD